MFFDLSIFSHDLFVYLLVLLISPIILLLLLTIPKFILSLFFKAKMDIRGNKLLEQTPEIILVEKKVYNKLETEILIKNFRNAKYFKSEFDNNVQWENKKFRFDQLENLELFVDHYAPMQSHAILIFNFIDEYKVYKRMCVSYEVKHEASDVSYVYKSIYSNYEGGYIVGSYEDLVGVRYLRYANFTSSSTPAVSEFKKLNVYKLNFTKNECQEFFKSLIKDINLYSKQAFFYNFVYRNCLSEILKHFKVSKRFNFTSYQLLNLDAVLVRNNVIIK